MTDDAAQPSSDVRQSGESLVWIGSPSQWLNPGWYVASLIAVAALLTVAGLTAEPLLATLAIIPIVGAFVQHLKVRSTRIAVTTEGTPARNRVALRPLAPANQPPDTG
jgi:hypothetical protein